MNRFFSGALRPLGSLRKRKKSATPLVVRVSSPQWTLGGAQPAELVPLALFGSDDCLPDGLPVRTEGAGYREFRRAFDYSWNWKKDETGSSHPIHALLCNGAMPCSPKGWLREGLFGPDRAGKNLTREEQDLVLSMHARLLGTRCTSIKQHAQLQSW